MKNTNKLTRSIGIILLSILMLLSLGLFTACDPNEPGDPGDQTPRAYTNENAKTVLLSAVKILDDFPNSETATVEVKIEGMTEYKGIDGWVLNSVDFTECPTNINLFDYFANYFLGTQKSLGNGLNINEDYIKAVLYGMDAIYVKVEMADNKLIGSFLNKSNDNFANLTQFLVKFNDNFVAQEIIYESSSDSAVYGYYLANSKAYACNSLLRDSQLEKAKLEMNATINTSKTIDMQKNISDGYYEYCGYTKQNAKSVLDNAFNLIASTTSNGTTNQSDNVAVGTNPTIGYSEFGWLLNSADFKVKENNTSKDLYWSKYLLSILNELFQNNKLDINRVGVNKASGFSYADNKIATYVNVKDNELTIKYEESVHLGNLAANNMVIMQIKFNNDYSIKTIILELNTIDAGLNVLYFANSKAYELTESALNDNKVVGSEGMEYRIFSNNNLFYQAMTYLDVTQERNNADYKATTN